MEITNADLASIPNIAPDDGISAPFNAWMTTFAGTEGNDIANAAGGAAASDPRTGEMYLLAHVEVPQDEMARLGGLALMPGMPVEVLLTTDEQRVIVYLAKPVTDQFNRAFREE